MPAPADWPPDHVVTGYWFLEEKPGWTPRPALEEFLSAGSPPLFIGFGSMGMGRDGKMLRVVEAALALSGLRAVVSSGSDSSLPPPARSQRVLFEEEVPHGWLFPRVAAVMHHGGAGTTAEALRAGVPSLISPRAADQFFWAQRVARLGAGPAPVTQGDLTPDRLAALFARAAADRDMRERACRIGEKIRAEDGVARAVQELLPLIGGSRLEAPLPALPARD